MIVLGIDPGSRRCGYGVVRRVGGRLSVLDSGVVVPGALPVAERLASILEELGDVIARNGPAEVAVEQVHCGASPRSALVLGQARGVALAVSARAGLPVFEYQPSEVKLAFTGSGRASKEQMIRTARALLGVEVDLDDEADAIALAVCHLARRATRLVPGAPSPRGAGQGRGLVPGTPSPRGAGQGRGLVPGTPSPRGAGQGRGLALAPGRAAAALARLRPSRRDHRTAP